MKMTRTGREMIARRRARLKEATPLAAPCTAHVDVHEYWHEIQGRERRLTRGTQPRRRDRPSLLREPVRRARRKWCANLAKTITIKKIGLVRQVAGSKPHPRQRREFWRARSIHQSHHRTVVIKHGLRQRVIFGSKKRLIFFIKSGPTKWPHTKSTASQGQHTKTLTLKMTLDHTLGVYVVSFGFQP